MSIKIAFMHHTAILYGASRSLVNLIEGLKPYGVESHVILQERGELIGVLEGIGCRVAHVPFQRWVACPPGPVTAALYRGLGRRWFTRKGWDDGANLEQVVAILREWQVDLIQSNSAVIPVGHFAARRLGLPHIWHLRELMEHYDFHFWLGEKRSLDTINSAQALIAISDFVARRYFDPDRPGIKRVIGNGILTLAQFEAMRERSLACRRPDDGDFVFGMIGMIYPGKRYEEAIRAFRLVLRDHPRARLVIAGGGDVDRLRRHAARLGVLERVEFPGFVDDPFSFYPGIDALVMCSRNEGLGRVTLEAQACCKPVIGYDDGGTSDLIEHGRTGLLYRGGPEELAAAMSRFLERPQLARDLGLAAWQRVRDGFSVENCAGEFYGVVRELLPRGKGASQ